MANHPAAPLLLREGDREKLTQLVHSTSVRAGLAQRARIVLLAADGVSNTEIAQKVGTTRNTVIAWRARYDEAGIEGLADHDRSADLAAEGDDLLDGDTGAGQPVGDLAGGGVLGQADQVTQP